MSLEKIISGAQTGADRAGLDAARDIGLETGGYCPRGCRTEEGDMPHLIAEYGLTETDNRGYQTRTVMNIIHSDATVIFGDLSSPGSAKTFRVAQSKKPVIANPSYLSLRAFIEEHNVRVLNVAGNRASKNAGVYETTYKAIVNAVAQFALLR